MENIANNLLNYGVLGIFALIMLYSLWTKEKESAASRKEIEDNQKKDHEQNKARIIELENQMTKYLLEDKEKAIEDKALVITFAKDCQKALENSNSVIEKNNELFQELIKKMK